MRGLQFLNNLSIVTFAKKYSITSEMPQLSPKDIWKNTWASPLKRNQILIGTALMLAVVVLLPHFFNQIQKRKGIVLNDWLLAMIVPHNVSVMIFAIIWGMVIFAAFRAIRDPSIYIVYCWSLFFVSLARLTCISLVPLDPPRGLIPLTDPLTGIFYGNSVVTKDLFFSGHTAILTLIFLCLKKYNDRIIGFVATITVAFLLLVQHIHYTIDVITAPIVVYVLHRFTRFILFRSANRPIV
jgi:hypothetical protein